jgi:hypothetical protein
MKRSRFTAGRYMNGRLYVRTAAGNHVALALLLVDKSRKISV